MSNPEPASPNQRTRVLYADDEPDVREVFAAVFEFDFEVVTVAGGAEALEAMAEVDFDVLVTDMRMDPMRGSELLAKARDAHPDTQRILLTGYSDHDDLADAVNRGQVFAYMQKPWDTEQLKLSVQSAAQQRTLVLENRKLLGELRDANARLKDDIEVAVRSTPKARLTVSSSSMARVLEQVMAVAGTDATVLIAGETGVGKELVAIAVHERSARKRSRFVAQNLAALPPDLLASELFGHVKGAFTGAHSARRGLFELADGGTLFLDEIGEAPPPVQAMLLRAIETREFWPVGASASTRVDVRIVAATNRDLLAHAQAGHFRLDLYYRLAVAPIVVPPLRQRPDDVRGLGASMLESAARRMGRPVPRMSDAAWAALDRHAWPGNVRELSNLMERLAIYHAGREVEVDDLGLPAALGEETLDRIDARSAPARRGSQPPGSVRPAAPITVDVPETGTNFDEIEREILQQVLARAQGNQSRAARTLGLSESTLRSRLKRLGLKG